MLKEPNEIEIEMLVNVKVLAVLKAFKMSRDVRVLRSFSRDGYSHGCSSDG